jgi:hypothetical protein
MQKQSFATALKGFLDAVEELIARPDILNSVDLLKEVPALKDLATLDFLKKE